MSSKLLSCTVMILASAFAMSGCSSPSGSADAAPPADSVPAKASRPFTAADLKVQITQNGQLSLGAAGTVLHVPVIVDNEGTVDLNSAAQPATNMGVHLLDSNGAVVQRDLVHASLGDIPAGTKRPIMVDIPAAQLADHIIAIVPVQEGVSWFDELGVAPLKVGPFKACDSSGDSKALCGSDGVAIQNK
jgi:hypothetical protein